MIDGSLTVDDMRLIFAIGKIFELNDDNPIGLDDLGEKLKSDGFKVGHGMSREVDILESKLAGTNAKGKMLLDRKRRGSQLTASGKQIVEQVYGLLSKLDDLQLTVSSRRTMVCIGLTKYARNQFFAASP